MAAATLILEIRIYYYLPQSAIPIFERLASWPPPAANACPSGLKMHSRGEDAFKEGLGGIQEELMWTTRQTDILCGL